jgi:PAS domain S-box-containing protein
MTSSTLRKLDVRYKFVLLVLAALTIGSYLILENVISSQRTGAAEINVAGRQRMLSQRIGFLFFRINQATKKEEILNTAELTHEAISLMERSHEGLVMGDSQLKLSPVSSEALSTLYFGYATDVDGGVRTYLKLAKRYLDALLSGIDVMEHQSVYENFDTDRLLQNLNRIVAQYQKENEDKVSSLNSYQTLSLVLSLVFLLVSWLAVFKPMVGKTNDYIGTIFDQQNALKESEERFRSISDSATMAMLVAVDTQGFVISWNKAAERLFGYTKKEMKGQLLMVIVPHRYHADHAKGFERACHSDEYKIIGKFIQSFGLHKDGHEFPIELSLGVWTQGGEKFFSAVVHDISQRKADEVALVEAKESAESANQIKSDFLANMSHELRTPLNGILGFTQMMMRETFGPMGNEKYKEYVEDVHHAGQYLVKLVNEILDISKIEAGQQKLYESPVNVADVVDSCVKMGSEQLASADLTLSCKIPQDLSLLIADETRVKQILNNLFSNAIKFTPAGGQITILVKVSDSDQMVLQVSDTGIGICKEDIPKILEPFEQVENILSRSHEGSGLGLPLVNHLVLMHGGTMKIDSVIDQGTTITISFPHERTMH